jgi:hypothetical protein
VEIKALTAIKAEIIKYKQHVRETATKAQAMPSVWKGVKPATMRKHMDNIWANLDKKVAETTSATNQLNECIAELEECKAIVREMDDAMQELKPILNTATMGTLRGLAKSTMKRGHIKPNKKDNVAISVYRSRYDESKEIIRGGRFNKTKRRKRK